MRPEKARNTKPTDKRKLLYERCGGICPECGRKSSSMKKVNTKLSESGHYVSKIE